MARRNRRFAQAGAFLVRLLGNLRRPVIADVRIERRDEHQRAAHEVRDAAAVLERDEHVRGPRQGDAVAGLEQPLAAIDLGESAEDVAIDTDWGEPGLTPEQRVFGWNTLEVLAMQAGDAAKVVGAIPGKAVAHLQLRYVVGTDVDAIGPAVRKHLDANGFTMVAAQLDEI